MRLIRIGSPALIVKVGVIDSTAETGMTDKTKLTAFESKGGILCDRFV